MRFQFLLLTFTLIAFCATAQDKATVSGQVLEQGTNQALPLTTIALKNDKDSTLVTGTLTDERGFFSISQVEKGSYFVVCSFVGFEPITVPIRSHSLLKGTLRITVTTVAICFL